MAEIELKSDSLLSVKLKDNGPQSTSVGPVVRIGFAPVEPCAMDQGLRLGDPGGVGFPEDPGGVGFPEESGIIHFFHKLFICFLCD